MRVSNDVYPISPGQTKIGGSADSWLSGIVAGLRHFRAQQAERRARAREINELHRLTDRELWDLGLSRADFMSIAQGTYRRD